LLSQTAERRTTVKRLISTLCLAATLLSAAPALAQVSFGIRIGPPPPARVVRVAPRPGPQYVWVQGYWTPVRGRYVWHDGYWTVPPYRNAHWVAPRYDRNMYYEGYWAGDRGRDDRGHDRDWRADRDYDRNYRDRR
jgi:hypothetical protein